MASFVCMNEYINITMLIGQLYTMQICYAFYHMYIIFIVNWAIIKCVKSGLGLREEFEVIATKRVKFHCASEACNKLKKYSPLQTQINHEIPVNSRN